MNGFRKKGISVRAGINRKDFIVKKNLVLGLEDEGISEEANNISLEYS